MTETTSVQHLILERHVYSPVVVGRSGVTTVMAQAAVGYMAGNFLLIVATILLVPHIHNVVATLLVPLLPIFGAAIGVPAGLSVCVVSQLAKDRLNTIFRALTGIVVVTLAWLFFALLFSWSPPTELWLLGGILLPGIGIGLVTGSRLRLWRELVRQGEPVGPVLRVFAAFSGVMLRTTVVLLFMVSTIALISILQSSYYQRIDRIWSILAFVHFAAGLALLFMRMKIEVLLPLAVIVNVPVIVRLFMPPDLDVLIPYVAISYLALWATFLLTRWRQTQVALSALEEEFRYYLID